MSSTGAEWVSAPDGEVVDAGLGDGAARGPGSARRWPRAGPGRRSARRPRAARRGPCCRAAPGRRRRRAPRAAGRGSRPRPRPAVRASARGRLEGRPTPPAATTWLSLTSAASDSDIRWLTPPPQRTAYFSSARRPGVVLRVSRTAAPVPSTASTQRRVSGGDAGQVAEQVQRGALAGEQVAGRAGHRQQDVAAAHPVAVRDGPAPTAAPADDPRTRPRRPGSPATTPSARATKSPVARWSAGTVATDVTSTPPARSSASAARTSASTTPGQLGIARRSGRAASRSRRSAPASAVTAPRPRRQARDACVPGPPVARRRRTRCRPARWPRQRASSRSGKSSRQWLPRVSSRGGAPPATKRRDRVQVGRLPGLGAGLGRSCAGRAPAAGRRCPGSGPRCAARRHRRSSSPRRLADRRPAAPTRPVGHGGRRPGSASAGSPRARSAPIRSANTRPSSSELEASRLAPCTPVQAHSPQAYRPGTLVRPSRSVRTPPLA